VVRRDEVRVLPGIGTRVRVPWGPGKAEGEVIDAYESGIGAHVRVAVYITGTDETLKVTFPLAVVEVANAA